MHHPRRDNRSPPPIQPDLNRRFLGCTRGALDLSVLRPVHILFLSRWFPYPADNGSKIRILGLLEHLAQRHRVSLLSFVPPDEPAHAGRMAALREYCDRIEVVPYRDFRASSPRALTGLLSRRPRFLVDTYHPEMADLVSRTLRQNTYDLVVASQLDMAPYAVAHPRLPAILDELELAPFRAPRRSDSLRGRWRASLTWLKLSGYLRQILPRFSACTVASEMERDYLGEITPQLSNVHVLPNAIDLSRYMLPYDPPEPKTLVYSGALTYAANYDAVVHFAQDILPIIRQADPQVRLRVTGAHTGVDLGPISQHPGIELTGYVEDVRPVVAQSWAAVVPLRQGGGTRLKILEAMALGTPVVATPKGAEGLQVTDGQDILLASRPDAFAASVIQLLQSPALRSRLAAGGRSLVAAKYDARNIGERLCALVEEVADSGRSRVKTSL